MITAKFRCVEQKPGPYIGFSRGCTYYLVDGKLIDDQNIGWPILSNKTFSSLADIKNFNGRPDWSYIGRFEQV